MLRTRSPLSIGTEVPGSFDLHVLSTPPAFVLSQDQTLRQDLVRWTKGLSDTIEEPLSRFNGVEIYPPTQQLAGIVATSPSGEPSGNVTIKWLCHDHEWPDTIVWFDQRLLKQQPIARTGVYRPLFCCQGALRPRKAAALRHTFCPSEGPKTEVPNPEPLFDQR